MKIKKLTSLVAAFLLCGSAVTLAACGGSSYSPKKLAGNIAGEAGSNGGFVATKGDFVYFINGSEDYTADNTLGKVEKGALMRISKSDLSGKKYENAEIVVPALFVAQNFNAGIYLFGDYVYFASPTTEKERDGSVSNSYISFKRAKLDGSSSEEELKKYFFRWEDNTLQYRFTEVNGVVYCMYVDGSDALRSYNTSTGADTVLVEGASSDYFFDTQDLDDEKVYYTMAVTQGIDSDNPQTVSYNQIYSVRADATATTNAGKTSYQVKGGYEYTFDGKYLSGNLDGFKAGDYTTYPYVNLGTLVLDGKGSDTESYPQTQFNQDTATPATPNGYTYTIQSYLDGGLYFTRQDVNSSDSDGENAALYYLNDTTVEESAWTSIAGNASLANAKVALNTTNASATAIYKVNGGEHTYMYLSGEKIYKAVANADGTVKSKVLLVPSAASTTLWMADDTYLYYYSAGTNGNNLYRVDYTGEASDYSGLAVTEDYKPLKVLDIDWNSSWYKPEMVDNVLLYGNAQSFGSKSYNYINAVNLQGSGANGEMTYAELKAFNEKYEEVNEYIEEFSSEYANLNKALKYWFRTGETTVFDDFIAEAKALGYKDHYRYSDYELKEFAAFTGHTGDYADKFKDENGVYYDVESYFYERIGVVKSADQKAIDAVWASSDYIAPLPSNETTTEKDNTVWVVVAIVAGVIVVGAAVAIPVVASAKKKAKEKADREATAVRKKVQIDTTDDKSIDVYADDEEETTEEVVEETVETVEEEVVEETAEEVETVEEEVATEEEATEETTQEE